MVHLRLNETETNPNPHINFISALHAVHTEDKEAARQLLRALAAQVRPVMKSRGFVINSFEEVRATTRSKTLCHQRYGSTNTIWYLLGETGIMEKQ